MFDTPEEKTALSAAIAEAVSGLKEKNTELLGDIKRLKRGSEIDPRDVEKIEDENTQLRLELKTVQGALKVSESALETATTELGSEQSYTKNLLIENGLSHELAVNGVTNPAHLQGATALLRSGAEVVTDGEDRTVKVGEISLSDYVKEWAASDTGKNYVAAPVNNGGGAEGGGKGNGSTADLMALPAAERMEAGRKTA